MLLGDVRIFFTVFKFFEQRNQRLRSNPRFQTGEHCEEYVKYFEKTFGQDALMPIPTYWANFTGLSEWTKKEDCINDATGLLLRLWWKIWTLLYLWYLYYLIISITTLPFNMTMVISDSHVIPLILCQVIWRQLWILVLWPNPGTTLL